MAWTRHRSFDGSEEYLTAKLTVPGLDKTIAPGTFGMVYRLFYTTADGVDRYWEADLSTLFGGPSFSYGHFDTSLVVDGDGSGEWVDGPNGYIQANIPSSADPTGKITDVRWNASTDQIAVIAQSDVVPNTGTVIYDGKKCKPVIDPAPEDE